MIRETKRHNAKRPRLRNAAPEDRRQRCWIWQACKGQATPGGWPPTAVAPQEAEVTGRPQPVRKSHLGPPRNIFPGSPTRVLQPSRRICAIPEIIPTRDDKQGSTL
jgi:hypothetical protein